MESPKDEKKIDTENQDQNPPIPEELKEELKFESETAENGEYPNQQKDIVAELRKKLKKSDDEKKEYLLGWQRAKADYVNSRKQDEQNNELVVKFAEAELLSELVSALDSFDIAFAGMEKTTGLPEEWVKGMEQIRNQLSSILREHKLEVIDPVGKPFDPREAETIGFIDTGNPEEEDTVISVVQKGYKLHGRTLRPAKVRVGKHSEPKKT